MANRKSNSPWGSSYKEGLPSTAVDDSVDIDQNVRATINTGVIDVRTGQWQGITVSDPQMTGFTIAEAIPNSGTALFPDTQNFPSIDMTGYSDIFIAIKPNNGGNIGIEAVMGPDGSEAVTADVWNILAIVGRLANQKNLQFKVTNSNLGESNIEFAFMRVV